MVSAVLGPRPAPSGLPGSCHQPSAMCPRCMAATSPGRWPVRRISFSAGSSLGHSRLTSASDRTRSRSLVGLLSTSLHGLTVRISCLTAHEKIADAEASTWLATIGRIDPDHHGADVGAGDGGRLQLAPAGQEVTRDQRARPASSSCCASSREARRTARQVSEGAALALRLALGRRVLALATSSIDLRRQPPRVGEPDRPGVAEMQPPRPAMNR